MGQQVRMSDHLEWPQRADLRRTRHKAASLQVRTALYLLAYNGSSSGVHNVETKRKVPAIKVGAHGAGSQLEMAGKDKDLGVVLEGVQDAGALGVAGAAVDVGPPQRLGVLRQRKDVVAKHDDLITARLQQLKETPSAGSETEDRLD